MSDNLKPLWQESFKRIFRRDLTTVNQVKHGRCLKVAPDPAPGSSIRELTSTLNVSFEPCYYKQNHLTCQLPWHNNLDYFEVTID